MLPIINSILDLWDPYGIYLFPQDEYTSYAVEIGKFIEEHKNIEMEKLRDFVFSILPPLDNAETCKSVSKVEYERFAKLLLLILNH